jgi:predicted helicase
LHLNYETVARYPLERLHDPNHRPDYSVSKMRLNGDKSELIINPTLTLRGIPAAAFRYKLGNRSALDWVIDQYQRKQDPRTGITSDPNDPAAPRAIVELVERVITVSVETMNIVDALPPWDAESIEN